MATGKTTALIRWTFVSKVMSLLFNMLSRLVIAFLPRSKHFLFSWLQSPSAVILEAKKIKSLTVSIVSPFIFQEVIGPDAMISIFWMLSFKPAFSLSSIIFIKRLFLSMGFSRQEYWSGLPRLSQGILPTQGLNLGLLHCRRILYHLSHQQSIFTYIKE